MSTLQFKLTLLDLMSGGFKRAGINAGSVFSGIDNRIGRTQKNLASLASPIRLRIDDGELERAKKGVDDLSSKMRNMPGGGGGVSTGSIFKGSFLGGLAERGVERGFDTVKELAKSTLEAGMDAEQQLIGLTTFLGKDKAKYWYEKLQKDSGLTPYTTQNILPGMLQLISAGKTPEKSQKDLWSLMNALSATGNAGNAFSLELGQSHLAQMAAVGKVDAYFMKEFERTLHIPMTKLLADYMKVPMAKIADWKESGELKDHVTYDMFVGALEKASKAGGMFAGALEAQSQTIKGKWSTIKDFWNIGQAKAVLNPQTHENIIRLEDRMLNWVKGLPELVESWAPRINQLFDKFEEVLPSLQQFGSGLLDLLKPIGSILISDGFIKFGKGLLDFANTIEQILLPPMKLLAASAQAFVDLLPKGKETKEPQHLAYVWDSGGVKGGIVDPARQKALMSSLTLRNMSLNSDIHFFNNAAQIDSFNRAQLTTGKGFGGQITQILGKITLPFLQQKSEAEKPKKAEEAQNVNDSIVNGGRKVINISFKNFVENLNNNVTSKADGQRWTVQELRGMMLEVLAGVPA
jgi:hypothetical protein